MGFLVRTICSPGEVKHSLHWAGSGVDKMYIVAVLLTLFIPASNTTDFYQGGEGVFTDLLLMKAKMHQNS